MMAKSEETHEQGSDPQVITHEQSPYSSTNFAAPTTTTSNGVHSPAPAGPQSLLAHGYGQAPAGHDQARIHPDLRSSHELATHPAYPAVPDIMSAGLPSQPEQPGVVASHPGVDVNSPPVSVSETDGRKAKRELSQSKRAAQNRAAQRAFRQRKEGYIKKLEQQVRESSDLEITCKTLQSENHALREYVIHLQSRLLATQGECPQPPPNVNLTHPQGTAPPGAQLETALGSQAPPAAPSSAATLEAVAQAVQGLNRADNESRGVYSSDKYKPSPTLDEDTRTAEAISRQLQADNVPAAMPRAPM